MRGGAGVTACFFGEGAVAEGEFHECINLAALWQLPVLFVCENNLYAMGTALGRSSEAETDLARKAAGYGMPAWAVDGMDVVAVEAAARRAVDDPRRAAGPYFLECRTYRFRAHSMFDAQLYRDKAEVDALAAARPDRAVQRALEPTARLIDRTTSARSRPRSHAEIDEAVAFAEAGTAGAGRGPRPASSTRSERRVADGDRR